MKKIFVSVLLMSLSSLISCEFIGGTSDRACRNLENGVYKFPELPENHGMTREEIDRFWDLPEDVASCISTEGLIQTLLDYPNLRLIMAGSNSPQHGYDALIRSRFLGARELETRRDRGTKLLERYKMVDPLGYDPDWDPVDIGHYLFYQVYYVEIILSQYIHLESLSEKEKTELVAFARGIYETKRSDTKESSVWGLATSAAILSRLMKMDGFQPFLDAYQPQDIRWSVVEGYWPTTFDVVEIIYELSEEYLNQLTIAL
ncbi:hypothetical protein [Negadavirga shengliensis]|uniref:DUF2268 domain-containing protein n=1 Tax=Negadavirga shengliensis TaxID=1389218 RepID=A0ABV9T3M0_9BACT